MKFGEKVRLLRLEYGLSQSQLGSLCGLPLHTIRNFEIGSLYPECHEVYHNLANALGCDADYLLTEDADPAGQEPESEYDIAMGKLNRHLLGIHDIFAEAPLTVLDLDAAMYYLNHCYELAKAKIK